MKAKLLFILWNLTARRSRRLAAAWWNAYKPRCDALRAEVAQGVGYG